jgi:hypothetical protein
MLLVTVPEWGHVSPTLHLAAAIQRCWDPSKGELQLSLASMEHMRSRVEARGIDFVGIGEWEGDEAEVYARSIRWVTHLLSTREGGGQGPVSRYYQWSCCQPGSSKFICNCIPSIHRAPP